MIIEKILIMLFSFHLLNCFNIYNNPKVIIHTLVIKDTWFGNYKETVGILHYTRTFPKLLLLCIDLFSSYMIVLFLLWFCDFGVFLCFFISILFLFKCFFDDSLQPPLFFSPLGNSSFLLGAPLQRRVAVGTILWVQPFCVYMCQT